jgi:hypothetical protein
MERSKNDGEYEIESISWKGENAFIAGDDVSVNPPQVELSTCARMAVRMNDIGCLSNHRQRTPQTHSPVGKSGHKTEMRRFSDRISSSVFALRNLLLSGCREVVLRIWHEGKSCCRIGFEGIGNEETC